VVISSLLIILFYLPSFLTDPKQRDSQFVLKMFLLILAMIPLMTPVSWYNMALFYVPMISYLVQRALTTKFLGERWALSIYFVAFCLTTPDIIGRPMNDVLEKWAVPFWGVIALVCIFIYRIVEHYPGYFEPPKFFLRRNRFQRTK